MNFVEGLEEIKRDLAEMGHEVRPKSYQNKNIEGNPDYFTKEITNYTYMVLNPNPSELKSTQPWADLEFEERISGEKLNPGKAWESRKEVWTEFINEEGKFDYSYPERFNPKRDFDLPDCGLQPIQKIAKELKDNPDSRQCFLNIWEAQDIFKIGGFKRVPCSLGYLFQIREGKIQITYLQRSADFATHFNNDLYLAVRLAEHVAELIELHGGPRYEVGAFIHWVGSLHIYKKDIKQVF